MAADTTSNGNGAFRREVYLILIAFAGSLILGIGSSAVMSYARLAVITESQSAAKEERYALKDTIRREVDGAATERERIQACVAAMDARLQRIEQAVVRIETKLERP